MRLVFILCFWLCYSCTLIAQSINLNFQLLDKSSNEPIVDAHVFIDDASIGTNSDQNGSCYLIINAQENQTLIISHIAYETLIFTPAEYQSWDLAKQLYLESNGIDLSQVELKAERGRKWKKNFKKFQKALLGEDRAASKCEILNPEVIRFNEKDGNLTVSAIDIIQIQNDYLQYNIKFLLEELKIESDGSTIYKGKSQFIDRMEDGNEKIQDRREELYSNSIAHFLRSLLQSSDKLTLEEFGYIVSTEKYAQGSFTSLSEPSLSSLISKHEVDGIFQLHFPEFLSIKHKEIKNRESSRTQINISGLEQQRFGSSRSMSVRSGDRQAISRLFKIEPYLLFDTRGNILNKATVREYGYWAERRLATTLPIDYKAFEDIIIADKKEDVIDSLLIFKKLIDVNPVKRSEAMKDLKENWNEGFIAPILDIMRLVSEDNLQQDLIKILEDYVPQTQANFFDGVEYLWQSGAKYGSYYPDFKGFLYSFIDSSFNKYFKDRFTESSIRFDEVLWGGVLQDGIPPLRNPKMIKGHEADYLGDSDVVFGLVVNGIASAYPKRILAWHEFFTDNIDNKSIAGVYCTLCGTVIIYDAEYNGIKHELGTSGFLYRSNKLMYDKATQSLWSTIDGKPVIGPLKGQDINLSVLPVETTTWNEWLKRYPNTKVLSLETGYDRNYDEGEAYKDYYASDDLMFPVPKLDQRLKNKARMVIPRSQGFQSDPLAVSVDYLKKKRIHQDKIAENNILFIAEKDGSNRVYSIASENFKSYKKGVLKDSNNEVWKVTDDQLTGPNNQVYSRVAAHEIFWFAWVNAYPETRIIK